jgi:hypothetical protein
MEGIVMAIVIRAQGSELLPTGRYRVVLVDLELVRTRYRDLFRWGFSVPDQDCMLIDFTNISRLPKSRCMRWASALLNREIQPNDDVDFWDLVGRSAIAVVVRRKKNGGGEHNVIWRLLPIGAQDGDEEDSLG